MAAMPDSDDAWEAVARHDPYWGVIAHPDFLGSTLAPETEDRFFASGDHQVSHVLAVIRDHLRPGFQPVTALDYGCGVGRNLPALAHECDRVVGLDVSPTMLARARQHLDERGVVNVELRHAERPGRVRRWHRPRALRPGPAAHSSPSRDGHPRSSRDPAATGRMCMHPVQPAAPEVRWRGEHAGSATKYRWSTPRWRWRPASHLRPRHVLMYEYDLVDILRVLAAHTVTATYVELGAAPAWSHRPDAVLHRPGQRVQASPTSGRLNSTMRAMASSASGT